MERIFIDVREPAEFNFDHLEGAINVPMSTLSSESSQLTDLPKDAEIILYCNSGIRAEAAMTEMKKFGFTNLINGVSKEQIVAKYQL